MLLLNELLVSRKVEAIEGNVCRLARFHEKLFFIDLSTNICFTLLQISK